MRLCGTILCLLSFSRSLQLGVDWPYRRSALTFLEAAVGAASSEDDRLLPLDAPFPAACRSPTTRSAEVASTLGTPQRSVEMLGGLIIAPKTSAPKASR